ncbi:MAG: GNAT family N-acetyltransferase [Anaerolineae bacterium]|nr:GNAT family N-acetyltransferase [Anaerolineae bacterium]
MKLDLMTTSEQFASLHADWNRLLPHNATNQIFLTHEWQRLWWDAYHPGELFVLVGRNEIGELIGVAPWFIEAETQTIRSIGCVDVTDYLDVIALTEEREAFLAAVADYLVEARAQFGCLDLCNIPDHSPTLDYLPRFLTERGFSVLVKQQEVCPIIDLPADFESYLNGLDKKQRHECRRKMRRATEDGENVGWYVVGEQHDLNAEIDAFLQIMAASHPEKAEFLKNPQHIEFFRTMMPQMFACGWLQLAFLTVNGERAATYLNFDYNNNILVYNSGLIPERFSYLSPGIVLLLFLIEDAIKKGRTEFDFLRGNEEYKYRMGAVDHPVMNLEAKVN